jgi:hypothetical protein
MKSFDEGSSTSSSSLPLRSRSTSAAIDDSAGKNISLKLRLSFEGTRTVQCDGGDAVVSLRTREELSGSSSGSSSHQPLGRSNPANGEKMSNKMTNQI